MATFRSKILGGLFWQYFQRIGAQTVSFVVSIILARLLLPSDFGSIALIGVFITISNIFIDSGLGNALIQRKSIDELDRSTVFFVNLALAVVLYILIFFTAPLVADYYASPVLCPLLRVLSLQLITMALCCVQNAVLVREMKFKFNFYVNICAVIVSAMVGISCAYNGLGVWSLVFSQLAMQLVNVVGYWKLVGWRPHLVFSLSRLRTLFDYGSKILAGSLMNVIYNNIYNLVIGKKYSASELGYYNRGQIIPTMIVENAANTINSVMFPALAGMQDDKERFLSIVRRMVSTVAFIVSLLMGILLPLSKAVISFLLTDRWLPAVPFMQIVCITVCFTPFILINSAILTALGESAKYLKAVTLSKLLSIAIIFAASFINVYIMVAMGAVVAIVSVAIMGSWNNSLIAYSRSMFLADILPSMLLGLTTAVAVFAITLFNFGSFITILLGGTGGSAVFLGGAWLLRFKQIGFIKDIIKKR